MSTAHTETHPSACILDCPDACSLDVTVADGRVVKIGGSHRNPLTAGFICSKVRGFARHVYSEQRLLHPAVRRGPRGSGDFERVSWDEALGLIAHRLAETRRQHGGEAILPLSYGGSNGHLSQSSTDSRLFHRLGASRLAQTVCAAATSRAAEGLYGGMPGMAPEDFVHARLIVVWGANPSVSGIHLVPLIREARQRGAKLVVVDPRRTPLAKDADLHLAVRPGTDLPVALALHRWLFAHDAADRRFLGAHTTGADELRRRAEPWTPSRAAEAAGIAEADLTSFARLYATTHPAAIRCGWGPERNRNGGSAIAAILALPAVAGKLGRRGGGYMLSNAGAWRFEADLAAAPEPETRTVNMNRLGEVLLAGSPAVRFLFVYNCNPLMTLPEQEKVRAGLARQDLFTVVFDQVMTDTARYADVVLPATTFLEHRDIRQGYGSIALQDTRPVIAPVAEARPNVVVFAELCRRLGIAHPGERETPEELAAALLDRNGHTAELRRALEGGGVAFPETGRFPVQFLDLFPRTADGKVHLVSETLDRETPQGLYAYREDPATAAAPLALVSPATKHTISSTLGQLHRGRAAVELHPEDAARRGLAGGDRVRVTNGSGEVICRLRVSSDLRPGVALLPKGLWSHNTENGATANALVPDTLTDLAGGACFNDARVEVEKVESG